MVNQIVKIRKNERSWAIELISQINSIAAGNDLMIKRAGGESTVQNDKCSMFPDVILYEDNELSNILQGWELKMPDVPITDEVFVNDAQRKARALGLSSCVIWNFTCVKFYVLNNENDEFEVVKQWDNFEIKTRQDVATYRKKWEATLKDVVLNVNDYFINHEIIRVPIGDVISQSAVNLLINENKALVAEYLQTSAIRNTVIKADIETWWEGIHSEYTYDEIDGYKAYAKTIILNWAYRIIFAHLIKRQQKEALRINEIDYETSPSKADELFTEITERCDFYNVFTGVKWCELLPEKTWKQLVELSIFLKENGIQRVDQAMFQNILERCVNTTRRELNGQYPTPEVLARILAKITVHDWTLDCADICCGTGTIAHAILQQKKELCRDISSCVNTTWASDKYIMPLQIANISLTSSDTINLANRLFQRNALSLIPGDTVDIVDPSNGNKITYGIPLFGAICSNLPFVSFENIDDEDKFYINKNLPNTELNHKSDLSYYIALHASNMMLEDGYLGIITSNSWLGTTAGENFYHALLESYNLKQVHISGAGRWFKNADVVTTILILQKGYKKERSMTNFFVWKKPIEYIEVNESYENAIVNSSLLDSEVAPDIVSKSEYTSAEIDYLKTMNISYNALFHNVRWLMDIKDILTPLESVFNVIRGSRRGWDKLFFPEEANCIEKEFIRPALFNAKKVKTLIAHPDREAFSCGVDMNTLLEKYPGAYKWVKKFENQVNGKKKPLPQVLKMANMEWYEMRPNEVVQFFTMMNPDDRIFFGRFAEPTFINQRLIGLNPILPNVDFELLHALLNSILMKFFIEAVGFGRGLGVLDINKDSISKCFMLNPEILSEESIREIKDAFRNISSRGIMSIEEEMNDSAWREYNHTILRAYGIENYYTYICASLSSLRKVRKAVKEKYEVPELKRITRYKVDEETNGNNYAKVAEPAPHK